MGRKSKEEARDRRKWRIRSRLSGTAERPRLTVFRSLRHVYAQVVDDRSGKVLATASSLHKAVREVLAEKKKKKEVAKVVGQEIGRRCKERGLVKIVFDRNGFRYHGRVAAVAEGAREAGLSF